MDDEVETMIPCLEDIPIRPVQVPLALLGPRGYPASEGGDSETEVVPSTPVDPQEASDEAL